MKNTNTKRKIAETVVGAAVGAAIAGPAGAVAGGIVGSQVAAHTPHAAEEKRTPVQAAADSEDPIVHADLKRILVPLDFSRPSRRTLRFARDWASRFGSEVCLLHVVEAIAPIGAFGAEPLAPLPPPEDFHKLARTELEALAAAEFPESVKVSVHLRDGVPYDEIVTAARELTADLIIIATHGHTGLARALLGSTAERVVRHAMCPVLTLKRAR